MNTGAILAAMAGLAIAAQVVVNTLGIRSLGVGGLIGVSGLATAAAGFAMALFARPEFTGRAMLYAIASGALGRLYSVRSCWPRAAPVSPRPSPSSSRANSSPACL